MSTLAEADFQIVMIHLGHARHHMRRLMALSQDWTATGRVEMEFKELRETVREFARCQCGIGLPTRERR
jgi:hypothetical protein